MEDEENENKINIEKNKKNENDNNKENEDNINEIDDYYDYGEDEDVDMVEKGQEEVLEEMFIKVKQDKEGDKINAYLDIVNINATKKFV